MDTGKARDREENAGLMAFLGFPGPPHRIRHSRPLWVLRLSFYGLLLPLSLVGPVLLWLLLQVSEPGRSLIRDTAFAMGLGSPLAGAEVSSGPCIHQSRRIGTRAPGHWECPVEVRAPGAAPLRGSIQLALSLWQGAPLEAGRVFGETAVRWPAPVLLNRWLNMLVPLAVALGLPILTLWIYLGSGPIWRRSAVRRGQVRSADLLTWQGRPWFAFLDDGGGRRFARASHEMLPLILDGVRTTGVALVRGRDAVLLDAGLDPLLLPDATRAAILSRAAEVQQQSRIRRALPREPGEPADLAGRMARIEAGLASGGDLARLYDAAWRLVWDADVADIAERALAARDAIAARLGPEAAYAALDGCRRRHAGRA